MRIESRFRVGLPMAAFAVAAFVACCCSLRATTIEKMSLDRMTQLAPIIVHARCVASSTAWDAGDIWTFTTFEVLETWKAASRGPVASRITVKLLGGTVGPLTSHVSGVPRFQPGEEVVLFLQPASRGDFSVVSWQQGTFRIRRGHLSATETATVTQDTAAFATFDPKTRRFEATGIRNVSLTSFRQRIAAAVASGGER